MIIDISIISDGNMSYGYQLSFRWQIKYWKLRILTMITQNNYHHRCQASLWKITYYPVVVRTMDMKIALRTKRNNSIGPIMNNMAIDIIDINMVVDGSMNCGCIHSFRL